MTACHFVIIATLVYFLSTVQITNGLSLLAGDNKKLSSPLVIKKVSKLSPKSINIKSDLPQSNLSPSRSGGLKISRPKKTSKKVTRSILPTPVLPLPIIPKLPFLPLFPIWPPIMLPPLLPPVLAKPLLPPVLAKPLLAPVLPKLILSPLLPKPIVSPLLPKPILSPLLPKPLSPPSPLIPRLKKEKLNPSQSTLLKISALKPLETKIKPIKIPAMENKKTNILEKLLDFKKKGSLTTPEFVRLKKLLLK